MRELGSRRIPKRRQKTLEEIAARDPQFEPGKTWSPVNLDTNRRDPIRHYKHPTDRTYDEDPDANRRSDW